MSLIPFSIVTRHYFYKKKFMIKVIQNFMEITLYIDIIQKNLLKKVLQV